MYATYSAVSTIFQMTFILQHIFRATVESFILMIAISDVISRVVRIEVLGVKYDIYHSLKPNIV